MCFDVHLQIIKTVEDNWNLIIDFMIFLVFGPVLVLKLVLTPQTKPVYEQEFCPKLMSR